MVTYKARFDTSDRDVPVKFIEHYCSGLYLFSFEEQTSNPHCHLFFESDTPRNTMVSYIRKYVGSGNGSYSLVMLTEEDEGFNNYLAYIIKDGDYKHNFSKEKLEEVRSYDKRVKSQIKERKALKRTQLQILIEDHGEQIEKMQSVEEVVKLVVQFTIQKGTLVREFQIKSLVQTLALKYNIHDYRYTFQRNIYLSICPELISR